MKRRRRIYGLDIIRGIAILLVLLRHAWPEFFGGAGIVGVVVFFALSGYLITGNLAKDVTQHGRVRYGQFYLHRAFRLVPALLAMLVGYWVVTLIWNPLQESGELVRSTVVALTYTANVPGFDHGSDALGHLWTLATEEQFYLVWPVVLMLGIKWRHPALVSVITAVSVFALSICTILVAGNNVERVYSLPTSWAVAMLMGALAFLLKERIQAALALSPIRPSVFAAGALIIIAGISVLPELKSWPGTYLLIGPVVALCSIVLVFAWSGLSGKVPMLLRPLNYLGLISYAAYLWNYPIALWAGERPLNIWQGLGTIVATIVLAFLSQQLIEDPAARFRRRIDAVLADRKARSANTSKRGAVRV